MGLTSSDFHQIYFSNCRQQGMTNKQILQSIPPEKRLRFVADINKTAIESHFGMKDHWFAIILIGTIVACALLANYFI